MTTLLVAFLSIPFWSKAQFYNGSRQDFGKNRIQHEEFLWSYYNFDRFRVYFYGEGKKIATYTALTARKTVGNLERFFEYSLEDEQIQFIVYNKLEHFRQSNIGYDDQSQSNIGGVTRIAGSKVFIYYDGDYANLERQIRSGIAQVILGQMMFGENWKEMLKNSALLNLPDWYINGLVAYAADPWNVEIDSRVKDGVLTEKYKKFNNLTGKDAEYAGHLLWHYIAEVYGERVIPQIIYMARVSRNVESGFLFVLGISLKTLTEESLDYYIKRYEIEEEMRKFPDSDPLPKRTKKHRSYTQMRISPDGRYVVFATHELGQQKVYLYDSEKRKLKKLEKKDHKLDRINDTSYPLLDWHPSGDYIAMINEEKGETYLYLYDMEKKKWERQPIFKIDKVLSFSFSDDGRQFVMSAMKKGQNDLFVYNVASKSQAQLTNDVYDDLDPRFVHGAKSIVFSSNRVNDTLEFTRQRELTEVLPKTKDLFLYDFSTRSNVLRRLTDTPDFNETLPAPYTGDRFMFLSDESGIINRYVGYVDSTISFIDTTTHYRYFTNNFPITNYKRNILDHDVDTRTGKYSELLFHDGRYRLYVDDLNTEAPSVREGLFPTEYRENELLKFVPEETMDTLGNSSIDREDEEKKVSFVTVDVFSEEEPVDTSMIDIDNYTFENEQEEKQVDEDAPPTDSRFIELQSDSVNKKPRPFVVPEQRTYFLAFAAQDVVTQFDFDFSNQLYQRFNGGPYINPGMGSLVKLTILDLFEDYKIEGGFRLSFNSNSTEYFMSFENRRRRLDKKYVFQRQTLTGFNGFEVTKTFIHQGKYIIKYPFSEVASVRATASVRNDRTVITSTDRITAGTPDEYVTWGGAKLEYIFDNTLFKGLNLLNGWRYKVFGEYYQEFGASDGDIAIVGFDIRHYQKIHKNFIWANRLAGSKSFGSRKLIYYLGAVDDWVVLTDRPRFDRDTEIDTDQNYYFQTIATNMRGFIQNIRNGSSFAVLNSELRFPVFKYFINRPIKSDFVSNFQVIGFTDIGTAWTGNNPYSEDNSFNQTEEVIGPLRITLKNQTDPLVGSYGIGLRSKVWGYFVRFDYAWGVQDGIVQDPITHLSLGLDF